MFLDEYIWYMVTKNLSILKINHLIKLGLHFYPVWNNGILFHHLEQRHFFGSPLAATVGHSGAQAGVVVVDGADLMHHHHHQMDSNNAASHRLESFSSMLARSSSMESISCVGGSGGESYNSAIIDNEEERHYPFKLTQSNQ